MDDLVNRLRASAHQMTHTQAILRKGYGAQMDTKAEIDREFLLDAAADRVEELERDLKSVLDRESATTARHDARIEELERERDRLSQLLQWTEHNRDVAVQEAEEEIARADRLAAQLKEAGEALKWAALKCEFWAKESRNGGWSTHQVQQNLKLAGELRATLARMKEETE